MNNKGIFSYLWEQANEIVRIIGWIAIVWFLDDHWPGATYAAFVAALVSALLCFLWFFFVRPFWAALKGEPK